MLEKPEEKDINYNAKGHYMMSDGMLKSLMEIAISDMIREKIDPQDVNINAYMYDKYGLKSDGTVFDLRLNHYYLYELIDSHKLVNSSAFLTGYAELFNDDYIKGIREVTTLLLNETFATDPLTVKAKIVNKKAKEDVLGLSDLSLLREIKEAIWDVAQKRKYISIMDGQKIVDTKKIQKARDL